MWSPRRLKMRSANVSALARVGCALLLQTVQTIRGLPVKREASRRVGASVGALIARAPA